jgi:hypothetical protein
VRQTLSHRLTTLVQGTDDVYLLDYVIQNLGAGDPGFKKELKTVEIPPSTQQPNPHRAKRALELLEVNRPEYIRRPLQIAIERRLLLSWLPRLAVRNELQTQEFLQTRVAVAEQLLERRDMVREAGKADVAELKAKLTDRDPLVRYDAACAVASRRPHLEAELIPLLDDPEPAVHQAAHLALVRLARGADFGAAPGATRDAHLEGVRRWNEWWTTQDAYLQSVRSSPAPGYRSLPPSRSGRRAAAPAALAERLVQALPTERASLLAEFREARGPGYSEALAGALPRLDAAARRKGRSVLAERLERLPTDELTRLRTEDDPELRRAARHSR